jgi:peptidoglycan hydrolase-like protein with peptidoglycan-binding domain
LIEMTGFPARPHLQLRWALSFVVAVSLVAGVPLVAKQKKNTHSVHHRKHRPKATRRYKQVRIEPDRVREIQEALAKAGVYHDEPSGRWDTATSDAMREYQKRNGFSPTGLPEAKPLLLLGLGPHPLPPGLGPVPASQSGAGSRASRSDPQTDGDTAPPAADPPTSSK